MVQGFCPLKIKITQFPDGFCLKVLVCLRELEGLLNQFFLSRSLDAFGSSDGLVLPTFVREKVYLRDSKKCN